MSSGTRVMPRRLGYVSWRPWIVMLMSGFATALTPAFVHERDQLRHVVVVHRVHGREMRAVHAALQAEAQRSARRASRCAANADRRSRRNACRRGVPARRRSRTGCARFPRRRHRALEVRNAADDVHAHRAAPSSGARARWGCAARRPAETRRAAGRGTASPSPSRAAAPRPRAAAGRTRRRASGSRAAPWPPPSRNSASARSTIASCVSMRLQLAPQRDAFEQRAALVHARQSVRQRRVHVEVRVDERRRQEIALAHRRSAPPPR